MEKKYVHLHRQTFFKNKTLHQQKATSLSFFSFLVYTFSPLIPSLEYSSLIVMNFAVSETIANSMLKLEQTCSLLTSCFTEPLLFSKSFLIGSSAVGFSTSLNSVVLLPIFLNYFTKNVKFCLNSYLTINYTLFVVVELHVILCKGTNNF